MGTSAFRLGATQTSTTKLVETINQATHGFVVGDVIRPNPGVTGAFLKAQADSASNAEAIGVVSDAGSVHSFTVVYQGECVTSGLSDFVTSDVLFLSADIAGKLTTTPPTLPGQVIKPIVVMNDTNEGLVLNYIGSVIGGESSVEVSQLQPVGAVIPWAGATGSEPLGWLVCDGATYYGGYTGAGTTYANLYSVIGTSFGGSGTNGVNDYFHVPNMMGRVPVGAGSGSGLTQRVLGVTGGAEASDAIVNQGGLLDTLATGTDNESKVSIMQPFTVTNYLIRYEQNSRASISGLLLNDLADAGTTGATVGNILQYESSGTTGVWEPATVSEALTKDAPIGFTGNMTMNSGNLTVSGTTTVGSVAGGVIIDQHGISAGDNTLGITGNITATDFTSGNVSPNPSNTIGGFGQVVPLLITTSRTNENSLPGGAAGASWFVHLTANENGASVDEDASFVIARVFDVPANNYLRFRTMGNSTGVGVPGVSAGVELSITTRGYGNTGTWIKLNDAAGGLNVVHQMGSDTSGNLYPTSGVSGGALFGHEQAGGFTTPSVAHGFAMKFS